MHEYAQSVICEHKIIKIGASRFEQVMFAIVFARWVRDREMQKKKIKFQQYGFLEQDDLGIWTTPDGAKVAWFADPDGNILSLTQFAN